MIITENNICFNIDTIKECMDELVSIDNKKEYFNMLVQERLEKCNKVYIEEFNNKLDNLIRDVSKCDNLKVMSRTLVKLSKLLSNLCSAELTLYKVLTKGSVRNYGYKTK